MYPPDVLPAFVAEMDFPLAPTDPRGVARGGRERRLRLPASGGAGRGVRRLRGRALRLDGRARSASRSCPTWSAASPTCSSVLTEPGDGHRREPAGLRAVLHHGHRRRPAGRRGADAARGRGRLAARPRRARACVRRRRRRVPALQSAQPDRPRVHARGADRDRGARGAARRDRARRRDPRADGARRRDAHPVRTARRRGGRARAHAHEREQGVERRRPEGRGRRLRAPRSAPSWRRSCRRRSASTAGHFGVLASVAAFDARRPVARRPARGTSTSTAAASPRCSTASCRPPATRCRRRASSPGSTAGELGLGDDPAAAFLEHGKVALASGPWFGTGGEGFARLNIGTSGALLEEAVRRMAATVELAAR